METDEQWLKRIGSKEAMEERQAQRTAGKLNKPIKGEKGLGRVVRTMARGKEHPLTCRCDECIPPWLKEEMKTWPVVAPGQYEARQLRKPVTVVKSQSSEPERPRKNWTSRGNSTN